MYVAVCGRRDAVMPRNVQKDPEAAHTWRLKDELVGRGRVYYAKLARGKATFLALRRSLPDVTVQQQMAADIAEAMPDSPLGSPGL